VHRALSLLCEKTYLFSGHLCFLEYNPTDFNWRWIILKIDELTIEQLQEMPGEELVNLMFSTLYEIKSVKEEKVDLLSLADTLYEADFTLIRKHIKYEDEESHFKLALPVLDERKLFDDPHVLPITNYFIIADYLVRQNPFGLLEVLFLGQHIRKNDNDFKHTRTELIYKEFGYFYFDEENNAYIQVNVGDVNKARSDVLAGRSLEKADEAVRKYIHREQLLKAGRGKLKQQGQLFLGKLMEFKKQRANFGTSIESILEYTLKYENFLEEINEGFKLYLLFGNISVTEYEKLVEEKERLLNVIYTIRSMLDKISTLMITSKKYGLDQNMIFKNTLRLVHESPEDLIYSKLKGDQLEDLKNFFVAGDLLKEGYIGYNLEKWELYPNLVQVEKRRNFAKESTNYIKQKEVQDKILRVLQKKEPKKATL